MKALARVEAEDVERESGKQPVAGASGNIQDRVSAVMCPAKDSY